MSKKFFLTLVITIIVVMMINLPAQAEWQYTRWGMSVDEVMTASKGEAIPVNPDEQDLFKDDHQQTLLKSQWTKEGYSFDVFFNFNIGDSQLSEIIFKSIGKNEDLGLAMIEEFGLPSRAQGGLSKKDSEIRGFRLVNRDNYAVPETETTLRNQPETSEKNIAILLEWNTPKNFIQMSRQGENEVIIRVKPSNTK
ncbi:hypothetical protein Sta7437_2784 [Stanieria cyanosphaera PCC 7437]|uniref:Uncharacterized protein n=1 Tax=Stanieria cyanosphaera (strain ATCC 29371 / PCC 7437) TaxID=111780 RepID=K9XUU3_STAC7|nr:hypothetical protein [Stanieria cyanosphaera]AFZ36308.1 hypothetical protein Sta7437_2784 [Stanieria cyanosphaera PCC 7437]